MSQMVVGNINLSQGWRGAIKSGKFVHCFSAFQDDDLGRWNIGDELRVSLEVLKNDRFGFQVFNIRVGRSYNLDLQERELGYGFVLRYNEIRVLKPGGGILLQPGRQPAISPRVENCGFNCQKPGKPESIYNHPLLAQVSDPRLHRDWHVYANIFPTQVTGQLLWLPVQIKEDQIITPHLPQKWTLELFEDFLVLVGMSQGMVFLWNSYPGGGASVLHFHIHSVAHPSVRPLEKALMGRELIKRARLIESYPARGVVWQETTARELYFCDQKFTRVDYPPNVIYIGGRFFMFPRIPDQEVVEEFPSGILGGNELTGNITTANRIVFETLNLEELCFAFQKATPDPKVITEILLS